MKEFAISLMILIAACAAYASTDASRYFYSGNGRVNIASKGGVVFNGIYRNQDGSYPDLTLKQINKVFGAKYGEPIFEISPRLVEFLDYLEDNLKPGARITIHSGFRSPQLNANLKAKGKLAAKASLHQYGMAADIKIEGVSSETVWDFIKQLGYGGAGFYHGALVHVDVGPWRSWDETTSGVDLGLSDDNKLIGLITDKDIYFPGEEIQMRFIKMTAFPIGVEQKFILEQKNIGGWKVLQRTLPINSLGSQEACVKFEKMEEMIGLGWDVPNNLKAGRYRITARFCDRIHQAMPEIVSTPEFEVKSR